LIISFLLTFLIKYLAKRHRIIDIPNERSSHTKPTPRGGGLAIVISWYLGISLLFYFKMIDRPLYLSLMSGSLLAIISLLDDLINLKPIFRLLVQTISASLAIFFLPALKPFEILGMHLTYTIIIYPILIIGIVWFINIFNFLDGIDAYASLEAIFLAFVLFLFTENSINLILIASISGFLYWNWPKAKIFMGDVGSTQLGFILIVLGIYFHNQCQFSFINWLMLSSPFWFDATYTLYRRWKNKEKITQAHRKHAYQRIVQSGFSHLKTDVFLLIINLIIFTLICCINKYPILLLPLFLVNITFLYLIVKLIDKRVPFK
jgi:UDP-N-acetylmuramyl pentapeptide phosphotransferase/UDP-N-acetylglucosamine-1-phosphate transferase